MKLPFTFERALMLALIIAVLFLSLCSSPTVIVNEGISEDEFNYRLKVLKQADKIKTLNNEIQDFKNIYEKDTSIIVRANVSALEHIITERYR